MKKLSRPLSLFLAALSLFLTVLVVVDQTTEHRREAREELYLPHAAAAAREFDVSLPLVLAVIRTESDFHPDAVSSVGARGLMQLMPETFLFLRDEILCEELADSAIDTPAVNIRYGTCYLAYLFQKFNRLETVLAAYNAGEGRVDDWLEDPQLSDGTRLTVIPFPETEAYVKKATEAYHTYARKYKENL